MYDALKEYKSLLDEGVITEDEFEKKKRELLGMPDKEEQQRIINQRQKEEEERQKAFREEKRLEAEHKRKLEETQTAEREHQRKLEEAKLAEQERQRKPEEEKMGAREEKKAAKKGRGKIIGIVVAAIVLIVGIIITMNVMTDRGYIDTTDYNAAYEWPERGLANSIPKPTIETGEISNDSDTFFGFYLYQATADDYLKYMEECKESGYTNVDEESGRYYRAYNEDGDRYVNIEYHEDDNEIYIAVRAPEKWADIYWPKSELAKTLPVPEKLYGIVNWDESDNWDVDIANVSAAEFNAYIDKCIEAGYNVDYSRNDKSFSAENASGNKLDIQYEYFNVMNIDVEIAE